jgi:N-formylglutamate amidohydrolase
VAIAPHGGFLIPEEIAAIVDTEDEGVLESLFRDADPFTDEFDFAAIGGVSVDCGVHRLAGDANRNPDDLGANGFVRRTGFDGRPLLKEGRDFTEGMLASLRELCRSYGRAIDQEVASLRRARPGKPAFMLQIHSMDEFAGASYGQGPRPRPDLSLIVGERGQFIGGAMQDAFHRALGEALPEWGVALNDPFDPKADGQGAFHLLAAYGSPREGAHALELEINKKLYLLPDGRKDREAFSRLQDGLARAVSAVLDQIG